MQFIHGIDLGDWFPCHNLALSGRLTSPNAAALLDPGLHSAHSPIHSTTIAELREGQPRTGVLSPRAAGEVVRAGILRRGQQIANGLGEVEMMSEMTQQFAIRCSDAEIAFEEIRRRIAPNAVSRLACLYLAERTAQGREMLQAMLGPDCYVLDVRILLNLNLTRVDAAWFDGYVDQPDGEYATNYWLGIERPNQGGKWEYLLDGALEVEDLTQLADIRQYGAKVSAG